MNNQENSKVVFLWVGKVTVKGAGAVLQSPTPLLGMLPRQFSVLFPLLWYYGVYKKDRVDSLRQLLRHQH